MKRVENFPKDYWSVLSSSPSRNKTRTNKQAMKIVLGYILSVAGKALFYVLIHYVQTNVNYNDLPLKYPQNQEQQSMGGPHADPKE